MFELTVADLWSAEAYLVYFEAQEDKMLDMLDRGKKPYPWIAEATEAHFPGCVEKYNYTYHKQKQTIHALDYGVEERTMAAESGLPREICSWQRAFYHAECPGVLQRQEMIKREVKATKTLTSLLGRRRYFVMPMSRDLLNIAYAWKTQSAISELNNRALNNLRALSEFKRNQKRMRTKHPLAEKIPEIRVALNTHDGFGVFNRVEDREKVKKAIAIAFNYTFHLPSSDREVTIPVSLEHGPNFNDLGDESVIRYNQLTPEDLIW